MKKIVIVVDAQNDFMKEDGNLPVPGADYLIEPINEYLRGLKAAETELVLYTFDTHTDTSFPGSPESEMFPPHCYKGTPGWELAVTAEIEPPVFKLEKNVFNMWEEKGLRITDPTGYDCSREFLFEQLRRNEMTNVEVVGVAADFCVKWAVDGLIDRGFYVTVKENLTAGIERQISQVRAEDWGDAVTLG